MPDFGFSRPHNLHQAFASCWRGLCVFALCLACAFASGCVNLGSLPKRQPPSSARQAPLDAYALSGGKITHFVPKPELLNDPTDVSMLEACRYLPLTSTTARSAYVIVHGRGKVVPTSALVIGKTVLVTLGEVTRVLGIATTDNTAGGLTLFPGSPQSIVTRANQTKVEVGNRTVMMSSPMFWAHNGGLVMTLPDMQKIFQSRAVQRGTTADFNVDRVVYHLTPDMKFRN